MSVHTIYYKDGVKTKYLRPVLNREEYMALRNGGEQRAIVAAVRAGDERQKSRLVQMCYGCLPNDDGSLKGSTRMSTTVGMDIDHVKPTDMQPLRERILQKKDELGLKMLELSARAQGYHLVFQRRPQLSQEENLNWASQLLGVKYDDGAKDITRVFYTTTGSNGDLLFLDNSIFDIEEVDVTKETSPLCTSVNQGDRLLDSGLRPNHEPVPIDSLPEMPKRLPKVLQLLTSKTPEVYKPAVAHAIFPSLGAHLWKVRFPYIDNVMHEATFMNVLMAGTGAGKDCISQPINHIMADIRKRDAENLKREADWKKEVNSKGSNKDKRQRPEGLVIQEVDPDMTNPAFVMRMAEADEHFLYTKMNEIDQFDALRGSARGSQQFQIMCLAFDPDNRYGQTRVGTQSVTEKVCIRFNWNAATTIQKGQRYFRNVLTDGPISRINFCTIPEREIGFDMPVYGTYDSSFDEELRPFIDRLCRAAGVIDCPQAYKLAKKLKDECAEFARLSQSRVYENLSFRANVIAYLKACVLYICNDYKWSKEIEDFVRWSLQYDLHCKMTFFGEAIENANRSADEQTGRRGPRNLLNLLPDEFTIHDADLIRQANGMDTRGTRNMLSQWVHRGYLLQMTDDSFRKVKS